MKLGAAVRSVPDAPSSSASISLHQHLCETCGDLWGHNDPNCPQQPYVRECLPCGVTWGDETDVD